MRFRIPLESGGVAELATSREKAAQLSAAEGVTAPSGLLDDLLASWDDVQDPDENANAPAPLPAAARSSQAPMAEPAPAGDDPLVVAPDAVWYVRPRSGGQFGPAAADVMSKWVTEGRVAADSLVWCEGWSEWKQASAVFGQLDSGGNVAATSSAVAPPPFPVDIVTQPASTGTATVPGEAPVRRRKSNGPTIVMVVMLTVLALVLMGVFIFVVSGGSSP